MTDRLRATAVALTLATLLAGCAASTSGTFRQSPVPTTTGPTVDPPLVTGIGGLRLASPRFAPGGVLPPEYLATAAEPVSPALEWTGVINAAAELALVVRDEAGLVRWAVAGIDPSVTGLVEGSLPPGSVELPAADGATAWAGLPAGPPPNRITFTLHVLDRPLDPTIDNAVAVVEQQSVASASLTGIAGSG